MKLYCKPEHSQAKFKREVEFNPAKICQPYYLDFNSAGNIEKELSSF